MIVPGQRLSFWGKVESYLEEGFGNFKNGFFQGISDASQSQGYPDVTNGTADKNSTSYLLGTGFGKAFVNLSAGGGRMQVFTTRSAKESVAGSGARINYGPAATGFDGSTENIGRGLNSSTSSNQLTLEASVPQLSVNPTAQKLGPIELSFDKITRTWTSPAGLDYGPGSVHGNRVKHVLDHAEPNPNKTTHSVFNVERNEVLSVVDEAWASKRAPLPNDPGAYVVPMGRAVRTAGETNVKVIVRPGTQKLITAYPFQ